MAGKIETGGVRLVVENYDAFVRQMHTASESMHRFGEAAQATSAEVEKTTQDFTGLGLALTAVGTAGKAVLLGAGLQASRIEELGILLEITRKNAVALAEAEGDFAKAASLTSTAVQSQAEGIRNLHLSGEVANRVVADLIRYNLDWSKATELARLAQDAATFAMQDSSQAVLGLINGITTLQPRVLRTYGLMINLNVAYRKFSETTGVAVKDMTILQRQQAAFNEVLSQAPRISGAYEAALDTAAKQIRSLKTDIVNLAEAFGEEYTPVLDSAVGAGREFLHFLTDLPDPIQAFIVGAGGSATALSTITGAAILLLPRLSALSAGFTSLSAAIGVSRIAMLGFVGAIPLAVGAITAFHQAERARQEEAASLVVSTESYGEYESALLRAGLANYKLSESLYNTVKAHQEATDAAMAQAKAEELVAEIQETKRVLTISKLIGGLTALNEYIRANISAVTDERLELYADADAMTNLALATGYATKEALVFGDAISEIAQQEIFARDISRAFTKEVEDWDYNARKAEEATLGVAQALNIMGGEMTDIPWAMTMQQMKLFLRQSEELRGAIEAQTEAFAKFDLQAAEDTLAAQEEAAKARIDAEEQKNEALEELAEQHADKIEDIYRDLAQVNSDLQKDIIEAERRAAQDRLELEQDLARDLEDLARELAQDLADLEQDRLRDLEDLQREYEQDRADAQRDLNRDLADLERDLAQDIEDIRQDHLQDLLELERDFAQQREDIIADFAQRAQDIEDKYSTEPEEPSIDELREALQEELRLLQEAREEQHGVASQREKEILAELEDLKQKELAQLEEEKENQLALLEEQLAAEQAEREAAYQEELAAAQSAYEERRAERLRQYNEKLEDLKLELQREKDEIQTDYARRQADLKAQHERERAETLRRHAEALADLDTQLAEEKRRLEIAAQENRARLAERLADEQASNAERRQEIEDNYNKRLAIIDAEEQKEIDEIEAKNAIKKQDWIDTYESIYQSTKDGLQKALDQAVRPGLQAIVDEHKRKIQEILDAWNNSGLPGQSPSPFFKDMAKSWAQGIKAGIDDTAFQANINSAIGDLQMQMETALPPNRVSLPMGVGPSNIDRSQTTNLTVNPSYQQAQSPSSIAQDLGLWVGTMRAWNR